MHEKTFAACLLGWLLLGVLFPRPAHAEAALDIAGAVPCCDISQCGPQAAIIVITLDDAEACNGDRPCSNLGILFIVIRGNNNQVCVGRPHPCSFNTMNEIFIIGDNNRVCVNEEPV